MQASKQASGLLGVSQPFSLALSLFVCRRLSVTLSCQGPLIFFVFSRLPFVFEVLHRRLLVPSPCELSEQQQQQQQKKRRRNVEKSGAIRLSLNDS
jgi:hypothetical protein